MCINEFENYSDIEKQDLLKDYLDCLYSGQCQNYDLFCSLDQNKKRKRKFIKAVVPSSFDSIDILKLIHNDNNLFEQLSRYLDTVGFEFPSFVVMCFVCGAIDCYDEKFISLKKLLGRGSKILLSF